MFIIEAREKSYMRELWNFESMGNFTDYPAPYNCFTEKEAQAKRMQMGKATEGVRNLGLMTKIRIQRPF